MSKNDIAIIGMSGRFPGAKNIEQYWDNLCSGAETISHFSIEELVSLGEDKNTVSASDYVRAKGSIDGVEYFDEKFFSVSPRDAQTMDPQHRIFLECVWEALEDSGYHSEEQAGRIGIISGVSGFGLDNYYQKNLVDNEIVKESISDYQININNGSDFLSTRVSYKFNFTGPSFTVQSGCSTSLLAISQACQNLLDYQCDMAIAGAVAIDMPVKTG
jgi:acyl transferase domain-containing protein